MPNGTATTPVDELTADDAERMLREACPGVTVRSIDQTPSGYTNRQWLAETDEGPLLVKVPSRLRDPEHSRHMIAATRRAAEAGLPVVRFRGFTPQSPRCGGPVLIQEFVPGDRATDVWGEMSEQDRCSVASTLGRYVSMLHASRAPWFGDVLGAQRSDSWTAYLVSLLDSLLGQTSNEIVEQGRDRLDHVMRKGAARFARATPGLTHGDLWLDNVILREGAIHRVLDFEHARYLDPLYDFGKPDELIFESWANGRAHFVQGYTENYPMPPDATERIMFYRGFHFLFMYVWFVQWEPVHVAEYSKRLTNWLEEASELT